MTFDDLVKEGKRYDVMRSVILRAAKMLDYPATNHYLQNIDNAAIVMSFPRGTVGLNSQGMVFCYAPYDIAAGCYGSPVIVIPYEELEN